MGKKSHMTMVFEYHHVQTIPHPYHKPHALGSTMEVSGCLSKLLSWPKYPDIQFQFRNLEQIWNKFGPGFLSFVLLLFLLQEDA
jgi:hypothetical protein